jgi:hypothetical protein
MQAAAENGGHLRLLTLLSIDHSLADRARAPSFCDSVAFVM